MAQKDNKRFYKKSFLKHGVSPQALHWSSKKRQDIRFEVLLSFIKEEINESTIADAGCGFGDLYGYMLDREIEHKEYLGIDCEYFMVDASQKRFGKNIFSCQNILDGNLPGADYYLCSGAMNILNFDEIILFIENCFHASKKGFVFNFFNISSFNDVSEDEIVSFCEALSDKIQISRDYLDNDFTIFMVK